MNRNIRIALFFYLFAGPLALLAQKTETIYLSGSGFDNAVEWEFFCSDGRKSGEWTTIPVPSCWEQEGFGQYNYGHDPFDQRLKEEGHYMYFFDVEKKWEGQSVSLVFEGVMTDARVLVNGKQAGEVHQGAFYSFSYEISGLLNYGKKNKLEVFVKKHSDNESVNQAERKADYWIFGGIFRPVFLEIKPPENIERVAVDARADGSFRAHVYASGLNKANGIKVIIKDVAGSDLAQFESAIYMEKDKQDISGSLSGVKIWTPEDPTLYTAEFHLVDKTGKTIHKFSEKIGFRTVELRPEDGIYVNGVRIKYKGVNRHSFHPDFGRTSSKAFSIEVVNLIKDMNMNAVRMSHYPPDAHFLDVCDSLGLFVLDELAGWQKPAYDSVTGRKLLKAMLARDVNHPSIVMWDNGNEGGWNSVYDQDFKELDIQKREVNHPWAVHKSGNTAHYVNYNYLSMDNFAPRKVFFPTELLHGLYDGGHGAGLEDFWLRMWNHPLCAGGFLWVFADEAVRRTDTGELDADGNHAPDGILGPYHEKEASFYTIRELWSPIHFEDRYITPGFNGKFRIQNRFFYTGLDQCTFSYQWMKLPNPRGSGELIFKGVPEVDKLKPGQYGSLSVPLPENWMEADVLYVEAFDPKGRLVNKWSWPVKSPDKYASELLDSEVSIQVMVQVEETDQLIILESSGVRAEFAKKDGKLSAVTAGSHVFPLSDGPEFIENGIQLTSLRHFEDGGSHHVVATYENQSELKWSMGPGGLLDMNLSYQPVAGYSTNGWYLIPHSGAAFSFPEDQLISVKYMGKGPYRVWKNRRKGVSFNVWEKKYNNTITGFSGFEYPEFKGYYSDLYWARFTDKQDRSFIVYSKTKDVYLKLYNPEEAENPAHTTIEHPMGDISFMLGIPAIGTKFKNADLLGPQSQVYKYMGRRVENGSLQINLTFDFHQE